MGGGRDSIPRMILCEHPTKAGTPCKNDLFTCTAHWTDGDRQLHRRIWSEAQKRGYEIAAEAAQEKEQRTQEMEKESAERAARFRMTQGGKQIVQFGGYAYIWGGDEPLMLGDRCLLPASWVLGSKPHEDTVTGFGTDYDGDLVHVMRVVERANGQEDSKVPSQADVSLVRRSGPG